MGYVTNMNTGVEDTVYMKDNGDSTYDIAFVPKDISQYYLEIQSLIHLFYFNIQIFLEVIGALLEDKLKLTKLWK